MFNSRLQTLCARSFSRFSAYEVASLRSKKLKLQFVRLDYLIPLFSYTILVLTCKLKSFQICGFSTGFFAVTLPEKPAAISLLHTVLDEMLMLRPALISFVSCWLDFLQSHKLSNFKCLSCFREVLLGLPGLFLSCTKPVSFRRCKMYLIPF